jgi:transposase
MKVENNPLPDDLALCHEMIRSLVEEVGKQTRLNEQLTNRIQLLLRRYYGPRAERYDPNQALLMAKDMLSPASAPEEKTPEQDEEDEEPPPPRRRKRSARREARRELPRKRVEHPVPAEDLVCPCCGRARTKIGEDVSEEIEYSPASVFVIEHVKPKYACRGCEDGVITAETPPRPIEKGVPGPGMLAHVAVSKYLDHLPLNRQEKIFRRQGLRIARSTLSDWAAATAAILDPVHKAMVEEVLASKVIHTDDTPVPVLDRALDRTRTGRLWVYVGDAEHPFTVFDYTSSRRRDGPAVFLRDFRGYLQADAYGGYDGIYAGGDVTEVACWVHARRKFFDARASDAERAHGAMARIREFYKVEHDATELGLGPEGRKALRQERSAPILEEFGRWLEAERAKVLPRSPISQAISYTLSNREALERFLEDGDLDPDNNEAERAIRTIAVGRKNWLFCGSDSGGRTAATLISVCSSCVRHGIDPWAYMRDLLVRVSVEPASRIRELLPDRWKLEREAELARGADPPSRAPPG